MQVVEVLRKLRDLDVIVEATADKLRFGPPEKVTGVLKTEMVRLKPELIPMVRVLSVLEYGPMKSSSLMRETGLDLGEVYQALGPLFDAGFIKTDACGWYYLPAQFTRPARIQDLCASCAEFEQRGTRVLACSVCDRKVN